MLPNTELFFASLTCVILCLIIYEYKPRLSIALLVLGSFFIGLFAALLDPYLNLWDEQYHALVAKNLSTNFFKPTLYQQPLLSYDYQNWIGNHIWLHKQPFFLWLMAISIKIFGNSEIAVRVPSIILHALLPLLVFKLGKNVSNAKIGMYGACLIATSYYINELVCGKFSTDHNDLAFLVFVTGSFWALTEYEMTRSKKWLVAIGLFAGISVLVKWLMGLLAIFLWFGWKLVKAAITKQFSHQTFDPGLAPY
ncbi:MAG: glycosyltransferase family 39 protein [Flavobacteriales bacterium]|nr:glycosyltransferase family 39 protein [Flavobacteriales bacterium]